MRVALWSAGFFWAAVAAGQETQVPIPELKATLTTTARTVPAGKPVWVHFGIQNLSAGPIQLVVPGTEPNHSEDLAAGLPLPHVFSGRAFNGLVINDDTQRMWQNAINYTPPARAPVITLGPYASIGVQLDASQYYPALKTAGRYRLQWSPYGGRVPSNTLSIEIAPLKQAEIETDFGSMTMRFYYEDAPEHVANFIELAKKGFYENLTFHKIEAGYYILGGCPRGDGTGIRPDGKKLQAEFNDRPVVKGTVLMGRLEDDPDSASSQFFISNTSMPQIEGRYTVFGQLVGETALNTLDHLMNQPVDENGRPKKKVYIRGIRISDAPVTREEAAAQRPLP
jgi:cyclophilin family peptidyl-prolyl cis-trans isomerase